MNDFEGKNALITGASSGIGKDMAFVMAEKGINLVLLARRESILNEIKHDLEKKFQIKVLIIASDLSQITEYQRIHDECLNNDFCLLYTSDAADD